MKYDDGVPDIQPTEFRRNKRERIRAMIKAQAPYVGGEATIRQAVRDAYRATIRTATSRRSAKVVVSDDPNLPIYGDATATAIAMGVGRTAIVTAINAGGKCLGRRWRYSGEKTVVRQIVSEDGRRFNTLREAAAAAGCSTASVREAARNGHRCCGVYWHFEAPRETQFAASAA